MRDRLHQLVMILLDNAIRHTPPGGHRVAVASTPNGEARLAVRDEGEGIAQSTSAHLRALLSCGRSARTLVRGHRSGPGHRPGHRPAHTAATSMVTSCSGQGTRSWRRSPGGLCLEETRMPRRTSAPAEVPSLGALPSTELQDEEPGAATEQLRDAPDDGASEMQQPRRRTAPVESADADQIHGLLPVTIVASSEPPSRMKPDMRRLR